MICFLSAFVFLLPSASAFWIIPHKQPVDVDRLDPIMSPGQVADHVHVVVGSNAFGPSVNNTDIQAGDCTTSPVQADKSNYWAPQLYHNDSAGTFTLIPISFVNTYYLQRTGPNTPNVSTVPAGLRMIAGDRHRTSYNDSNVADRAISFVCLDDDHDPTPQTSTFPTANCKDGLRAQILFPSCWNGKDLDSEDHQAHMSYPIGAPDTGDCPADFPVKIITLFVEWAFDVGNFAFTSGQNNWLFSTGDNTGLGFHADFMNGWDQPVLDAAVAQCTGDLFSNLKGCDPFTASLDYDKAASCKKTPMVQEDTIGPMAKLPGCHPTPVGSASNGCPGLVIPAITGVTTTPSNTTAPVTPVAPTTPGSGDDCTDGEDAGDGQDADDCDDEDDDEDDEDCSDEDEDPEDGDEEPPASTTPDDCDEEPPASTTPDDCDEEPPASTSTSTGDDGCTDESGPTSTTSNVAGATSTHHHHHHHHGQHTRHAPRPTPMASAVSRRMVSHRRGGLNRLASVH